MFCLLGGGIGRWDSESTTAVVGCSEVGLLVGVMILGAWLFWTGGEPSLPDVVLLLRTF